MNKVFSERKYYYELMQSSYIGQHPVVLPQKEHERSERPISLMSDLIFNDRREYKNGSTLVVPCELEKWKYSCGVLHYPVLLAQGPIIYFFLI